MPAGVAGDPTVSSTEGAPAGSTESGIGGASGVDVVGNEDTADSSVGGAPGTPVGSGSGGLAGASAEGVGGNSGEGPMGGAGEGGRGGAAPADDQGPNPAVEAEGGSVDGDAEDAGVAQPQVTVTLPPFVTSGPNDYWNTGGQVTQVNGAADLIVEDAVEFQRWDGFGGTYNEAGWDALSVVGSEITRALTLLFDPQEGANFVYGRIPIGASDYAMDWYTLAETPDDYAMADFSLERDRELLIPYIKASLEINPNVRLWASPWVVPGWMMDGQNLRSDAQTMGALGLYFAKFVEEYEREGLLIEAVHPQNEPGYARVKWTTQQFIDFIKTYLGPTLEERGLATEIWCGTLSHPDDASIATALIADPDALRYTTGFGLQWNLEDTVAELARFGSVMQTEHRCGNYDFSAQYWDQSRYDPNNAQNDHLYGEESWQLIRDWIAAGVNSYLAWNMVLDTFGKNLGTWHQNALLVVDRETQELIVTPAYYVFRHWSQYIAPGATRIQIGGSNDAVAFKNPDDAIIVQVYNPGESAQQKTVAIRGTSHQFEVPAHGWATLRVER
jgi:glucosylceramidase